MEGQHSTSTDVKFGTEWTRHNLNFIGTEMWDYSPQNCPNLPRRANCFHEFYEIFSIYVHLHVVLVLNLVTFGDQVISTHLRWGHFPINFQLLVAVKLFIGSEKVRGGAKSRWTSSITWKIWWGSFIRGPLMKKCVFCLSHLKLFVKTEMVLSSAVLKTTVFFLPLCHISFKKSCKDLTIRANWNVKFWVLIWPVIIIVWVGLGYC